VPRPPLPASYTRASNCSDSLYSCVTASLGLPASAYNLGFVEASRGTASATSLLAELVAVVRVTFSVLGVALVDDPPCGPQTVHDASIAFGYPGRCGDPPSFRAAPTNVPMCRTDPTDRPMPRAMFVAFSSRSPTGVTTPKISAFGRHSPTAPMLRPRRYSAVDGSVRVLRGGQG